MATQITALGLAYQAANVITPAVSHAAVSHAATLPPPALIPVVVRKMPKAEEILETPLVTPIIIVCPAEVPEIVEPWTTEDSWGAIVKYRVEVVLIAAGNSNFTAVNMNLWFSFREQIRRLFQWGIEGIVLSTPSDLFFARVLPEVPLDRPGMNRNYEISGDSFEFWVSEVRTN